MDKEYLRELAEEGAAIHSDPQPEREVCDGLIWALDEIERLRSALRGLLAFDLENDGATCDWPELQVAIKAARDLGLGPNV